MNDILDRMEEKEADVTVSQFFDEIVASYLDTIG